jgi:hypothetical protein
MLDITPILEALFEIIKVIALGGLSVLVPFTVNWLLNKTKIDELLGEDIVRNYMYDAFERAIVFGANALEIRAGEVPTSIEVKNEILAIAGRYAVNAVPDALERFGVDPKTADGQARLQAMLVSRFEDAMGVKADPSVVDGVVRANGLL